MSKHILIISDAYPPQTNGVVTTLTNLVEQLRLNHHKVWVYHPNRATCQFGLPYYSEIKLALIRKKHAKKVLTLIKWDHVHIATLEGPLGYIFSRTCKQLGMAFSASCHTKFPEYVHTKLKVIPISLGWRLMKRLYNTAEHILTTTESMKAELVEHGITTPISIWSRGIKRDIFSALSSSERAANPLKHGNTLPVLICVARVSSEKNLIDFFTLDIPSIKIMVGSGPDLDRYAKAYPEVTFVGLKKDKELAQYYQYADVFVFPSKTDTFGVVIIESLACGTPVAAYDVTGPKDILQNGYNGYISHDLKSATEQCLGLDRSNVVESSQQWSWEDCYERFISALVPIR